MQGSQDYSDQSAIVELIGGKASARILVVDDEPLIAEIIVRKLSSRNYDCDMCHSGERAVELLCAHDYDLLVTDVSMPGMNGIELLEKAKSIRPEIAIILVTSVRDIRLAIKSLKEGAFDYVQKPFSLEGITLSVMRALDRRALLMENRKYQRDLEDQVSTRTGQLKQALEILHHTYHSTLVSLGTALDSRDADNDGHALRVTSYTTSLARHMGLAPSEIRVIEQGALLHDIGKIGVPDEILQKPGPLTPDERLLIRQHPEIGFRILSGISFLHGASQLVLGHQEKFDGTGYPEGLQGERICIGARIFAVADTLDCMTSNRPFQPAASFEAARDEIERVAGTQLDPSIVARFLEIPLQQWKDIREEVQKTRR